MPTVTWICQRCCCGVCFQLSLRSHQAAFLFHLKALTFPLMCLWKRRAMVPGRGEHNVGTTSALAPGAEDVLGGCRETPSFPPRVGSSSVPCQEQELPLLSGSVPWMVALLDFWSKGARVQWGVTSPCAVPEVGLWLMNPTLAPCIIKTVTSNSFPATILLDEMQSQIGPHITVLVAVHLQLISLVKLGPCPITFAALSPRCGVEQDKGASLVVSISRTFRFSHSLARGTV
ncbi:hypothetical protein Anapl_10863 [Anas platyrhynchos]|uniref:Uncharacterized protein n=1 Tax=Anas platyrhynchos TaxID=8839 RepID=R0K3H1_ANAPL|nr:hypothetical protein Anapl_10863 [Anas platyrhynchos]